MGEIVMKIMKVIVDTKEEALHMQGVLEERNLEYIISKSYIATRPQWIFEVANEEIFEIKMIEKQEDENGNVSEKAE
jgi:formylmethanofuran dehydrogenase subunit E